VRGSLRERSPGVWQVRVSLGRNPGRYADASTTVQRGRRDAQRAAAKLVSQAHQGRVTLSTGTLEELLARCRLLASSRRVSPTWTAAGSSITDPADHGARDRG